MNSNIEELLDDLLVDWELAREEGRELSADQLCKDNPELAAPLSRRMELLRASSWMLIDQASVDGSTEQNQIANDNTKNDANDNTVDSFVTSISDSGVLTDTQLEIVRERAKQHEAGNAAALAQRLVQENLLTDYQVHVLLDRAKSPLLLDRYVVLDAIGSGGMGLVFKGFHRAMERVVAIKVLPQHAVDSPEKVQRFQREVKSAAKFSHPNIVAAYDAHERNGTYFLVMEYVEGDNLLECVDKHGPMPVDDAVRVVDQIAGALDAAHQKGMVHRDVKPTNVMLTSNGTAKLLDLGLVRTMRMASVPASSSGQQDLTQDGLAMGTASYMSPEQAMDASQADARSDIYSLGCTLYFLLTGRAPFQRNTTVQTIVAHREVAAPSLSETLDDIPASLEKCYQRMVMKSPEERFQSIAELRTELTGGKPPSLHRELSTPDAKRHASLPNTTELSSSRSPWIWAPIAAGLCLLLAIGFLAMRPSDPDTVHRNLAKWAIVNAGYATIATDNGDLEIVDASEIPDGSVRVVGLDLDGSMGDFSLDPIFRSDELRSLTLNSMSEIPIQKISQIKTLETLSLFGCDVSDEDIKLIADMSSLDTLMITDCPITDDGVVYLSGLTGLTYLDLTGTDVTDIGLRLIGNLKMLQGLDLTATLVKGSGLAHLDPHLSTLYLTGCDIDDDAAGHLKGLRNLDLLDVTETLLTEKGVRDLAGLKQLTYLDIGGISVPADAIEQFAKLPLLTYLGLSGQEFDGQQIDAITKLQQIEDLDLSNTNLDDEGFLKLLALKNLMTLEIDHTPVSQSAIDRFDRKRPSVTLYVDAEDL
jgi:serine/threonine protein kinase